MVKKERPFNRAPLWYKEAIIYEVHVRAFYDSNGDGIGDFRGLAQKLDYLKDLGVTAIWLLPFYPSPLLDDGYDTANYLDIHPNYGSLRDFSFFLKEAHRRDLYVISELVLNHTSDQHPWFAEARRAPPGSRKRNYYVWSDTAEKYQDARIIFKDFEPSNWRWDPIAKAYYWHRFYSHQPDLNFESDDVKRELQRVIDFWLGMGIDGLRLDAVPYLYERDGTTCENLPETHAYLKELRRYVDSKFEHRMLLAEANQWPEDAGAYFGAGDECHMAFHFPVMPRLFMAIRMEDRYPVIDILEQTPPIPPICQWAVFLRNHDELTLEMVTDEDRDYMYRAYAQDRQARINLGIRRRLAPLLENDRRRIELMNALLFSLPGAPVIYYGDEIGMGDNIYLGDRNGVRTPMQWSLDRNAGFSQTNPQRLYLPAIIDPPYHYESVNVEVQQQHSNSLLWWMRRLVALRKRYRALGLGQLTFIQPDNRKVLAFVRSHEEEVILIVANLSRSVQYTALDLSAYLGRTPIELFGYTRFPALDASPYFITLSPYSFYWFSLERLSAEAQDNVLLVTRLPEIALTDEEEIGDAQFRRQLVKYLPEYLERRRWFAGKARVIKGVEILEWIPWPESHSHIVLSRVEYSEGDPDIYMIPFTMETGKAAERLVQDMPSSVAAKVKVGQVSGILYDAVASKAFCDAILQALYRRRRFQGQRGEVVARANRDFHRLRAAAPEGLSATVSKNEQSNTSIVYETAFIFKFFRRLEAGINPEVEITQFLNEKTDFTHVPRVLGVLSYQPETGDPLTLGVLQDFIFNEGDAWQFTVDTLNRYFEQILSRAEGDADKRDVTSLCAAPLIEVAQKPLTPLASEVIGPYLQSAELLGKRTAELHLMLASDKINPDFAPEPFSSFYQRSLYQSMRAHSVQTLELLRKRLPSLAAGAQTAANAVLAGMPRIQTIFQNLLSRKIAALRIRCHGDYHLGQVLYTGKDFVIIDFEGEPLRSLSFRRLKRSPLQDVASMLESFHYAASVSLRSQPTKGHIPEEKLSVLEPWAKFWTCAVRAVFWRAYLQNAESAGFLPTAAEDIRLLLEAHWLEKAIYELEYELNNRPDWVVIPLAGILSIITR